MNATLSGIVGQFDFWRQAALPAPLTDRNVAHVVVGCGTSYNLALSVAAALNAAGLRALAVPAGEWVLRPTAYLATGPVRVIALSRSGETTETVQAARVSRERGLQVLGITCAPGSALSANADVALEFATHPDEGVVMTASASLMLLAGYALAGHRADDALIYRAQVLADALGDVPMAAYAARSHFVFLGGGSQYGIALEGALKLQEMAITYTQAFHPGEYRHGPVSLVDHRTAVVMLYHPDTARDEAALVAELQAKGAWVLGLGGPGDIALAVGASAPLCGLEVLPALQMLGETYAAAHGIDTTTPRHLTKVVVLA
jgi:glucosamine--fructose-6-phosphate aminotransferase (isomerizing)